MLATKSQTWTQHAVDLGTQYALLCDETNQRLRYCADYLRRGMGSAATHLADCQPNLAQALASLQFPERPAWADLCVKNGMAAPAILESECPVLDWQFAEQRRNDEMDEVKPLQHAFKSIVPTLPRHRSCTRWVMFAILVAVLMATAGICCRYLPYLTKWASFFH